MPTILNKAYCCQHWNKAEITASWTNPNYCNFSFCIHEIYPSEDPILPSHSVETSSFFFYSNLPIYRKKSVIDLPLIGGDARTQRMFTCLCTACFKFGAEAAKPNHWLDWIMRHCGFYIHDIQYGRTMCNTVFFLICRCSIVIHLIPQNVCLPQCLT